MNSIHITKAKITYTEYGVQQLYIYISDFPDEDNNKVSFILARSEQSAKEQADKIGGKPIYLNTMSNLLRKLEVLL